MDNNLIFETENFTAETFSDPHITRADGGHIIISPKVRVHDRQDLSPSLAVELAWLEMMVGEAMTAGLRKQGVDIGIINYQENKNWGVFDPEGHFMHVHLYGRAKLASIQKYGEACHFPHPSTGFYDGYEPLTDADIKAIQAEIETLLKEPKYQKEEWKW